MRNRGALALALISMLAASASAAPVTYVFTGLIDTITVQGNPYTPVSGAQVGDSMTATITFESVQADGNPDSFGVDQFAVDQGFGATVSGALDGNAFAALGIVLSDCDQIVFSSEALQVPGDLSVFEQNLFDLHFAHVLGQLVVRGHVTQRSSYLSLPSQRCSVCRRSSLPYVADVVLRPASTRANRS